MKPKIELGQVRDFGDIISDTFVFVRQNFVPLLRVYFTMCGAFLVTGVLSSIAFDTEGSFQDSSYFFSLPALFRLLFMAADWASLTVTALSYMAVYKEKGNAAPTVVEVWGYFKYYYFRVFFAQLILGLALLFASAFCFFPGVYLFPIFLLVCPIMVMENTNLEYAVKKAFKIIKENWWLTFGVILIVSFIVLFAFMICFLPPLLIYSGGHWLTGKNMDISYKIIASVIQYLTEVLWLLPVITVALAYYALTEQKEAGNLINRIKMFGNNNLNANSDVSDQY